MIVNEKKRNFVMKIINSLIAKYLIGKSFTMKDWIIGHDGNNEPVINDVQFIVRRYNNKTQELDIDIAEVSVQVFIEEYRNSRIQKCN